LNFWAKDGNSYQEVNWQLTSSPSGAKLSDSNGTQMTNQIPNTAKIKYLAGDNTDGQEDILQVTNILSSGENKVYQIKIMVVDPVLEKLELCFLNDKNLCDINSKEESYGVGEMIENLGVKYQIAGMEEKTVSIKQIPSYLRLKWSVEPSDKASITNGVINLLAKGNGVIKAISDLNQEIVATLAIDIQGRKAEFKPDSNTFVNPEFPGVDSLIKLETEVYFADGIDQLDNVSVVFPNGFSPNTMKLTLDEKYQQDEQNAAEINEEETSVEIDNRQTARFVGEYRLPDSEIWQGRNVKLKFQLKTKEGRISTLERTILIGGVNSLCTTKNRTLCLLNGLKCLKVLRNSTSTESEINRCSQIALSFTDNVSNFNIAKVLQKYKSLKR
ncbi:MAG TPA: hypothetical protein PLQ36_03785, partial [Candidatus Gracilibacteria bacterium]|nr:hypothetical protein [Candidatus Gracilibacteria bacterium]